MIFFTFQVLNLLFIAATLYVLYLAVKTLAKHHSKWSAAALVCILLSFMASPKKPFQENKMIIDNTKSTNFDPKAGGYTYVNIHKEALQKHQVLFSFGKELETGKYMVAQADYLPSGFMVGRTLTPHGGIAGGFNSHQFKYVLTFIQHYWLFPFGEVYSAPITYRGVANLPKLDSLSGRIHLTAAAN